MNDMVFTSIHRYALVPAATAFAMVAATLMAIYTVKCVAFLMTGRFTTNMTTTAGVVESFARLENTDIALGVMFVASMALMELFAHRLKKRARRERRNKKNTMAVYLRARLCVFFAYRSTQ